MYLKAYIVSVPICLSKLNNLQNANFELKDRQATKFTVILTRIHIYQIKYNLIFQGAGLQNGVQGATQTNLFNVNVT